MDVVFDIKNLNSTQYRVTFHGDDLKTMKLIKLKLVMV